MSLAQPAQGLPKFFGGGDKPAPSAGELAQQESEAMQALAEAQATETAGKNAAAAKAYEKLAEKYKFTKSAATAQFRAGMLYESEGKRERAFDAFQALISNHSQSTEFATALEHQYNIATDFRSNRGGLLGIGKMTRENLREMYTKIIASGTRSPFAAKAQFAIGELWAEEGDSIKSAESFQKVVDNFPESKEAADAAYKIGKVNQAVSERSNDMANLTKTREAFEGAISAYGNDPQSAEARAQVAELTEKEATKAYDTGMFYEKKNQLKAAVIYYNEVLKAPSSAKFADAKEALNRLGAKDPKLLQSIPGVTVARKDLVAKAAVDIKNRKDYLGPPAPAEVVSAPRRPAMRNAEAVSFGPIEDPALPAKTGDGLEAPMKGDLLLPPPPGAKPVSPLEVPPTIPPAPEPGATTPPPAPEPAPAPPAAPEPAPAPGSN